MQMLIRQPGCTLLERGESVEIAACPDSPGRETWQWDIHLEQNSVAGVGTASAVLEGLESGPHFVNVRFDERVIEAEIESRLISKIDWLEREEHDLWVAIVESGKIFEGTYAVNPGDVMVWEGDDPLRIAVCLREGAPAGIVIVRIRRRDGKSLRWVP